MTIISTPKVMTSIFWSLVGFLVIAALPPNTKFTADCFCGDIIPMIIEGVPFDLATSPRQLTPHTDNTNPHRAS
jgi:hypothetical protein